MIGKKTFLGIDGGGTKTEFVLFYKDGTILKRAILTGSNPNTVGFNQTYKVLNEGINLMKTAGGYIDEIFAGVAGCFTWSGFDYRGEPNPYKWPSVISHWGFTDYCGFKKDTAFLLAAWYKEELFAHLFPHWNQNEGEKVRVCVYTNGETAELFLNGKSLGIKDVKSKRAECLVVIFIILEKTNKQPVKQLSGSLIGIVKNYMQGKQRV